MLSERAENGELDNSYRNLSPCPESVHVGKCLKSSFANWFLYKSGERFNLSNIRVLFNDKNPEVKKNVRAAITFSAVHNRDRMSVEDLLLLLQPELQESIKKVSRIVQTIVPEQFRLYKGNSSGVLKHPVGVCIASHGMILVTDKSQSHLFSVRLHYPCDVREVSKSLQSPHDVVYASGVVYVADTGNQRIAYMALSKDTFLKPKRLKVQQLKEELQKRGILCQGILKNAMVESLQKWISDERKSAAFTESDLSQLHLDNPIHSPLGLAIIDGDLLAVSDLETNTVYQIALINTGASLRGTVTEIVKLAQGAEPYGLAYSKNHLYIGDSSPNGGVLKVSLESHEVTVVLCNGTVDCNTVHGIAVNNDGKIYFTDRESRKLAEILNNKVTIIVGCENDGLNDGSSSCDSFSQPPFVWKETLYM